jgi:hypothetical protein
MKRKGTVSVMNEKIIMRKLDILKMILTEPVPPKHKCYKGIRLQAIWTEPW